MFLTILMVAEMAEYACPARIRNVFLHGEGSRDGEICVSALIRSIVLRMMGAEMANYAFSARIRNVLLHSGDCRDGRICVFSADPQGLFTF